MLKSKCSSQLQAHACARSRRRAPSSSSSNSIQESPGQSTAACDLQCCAAAAAACACHSNTQTVHVTCKNNNMHTLAINTRACMHAYKHTAQIAGRGPTCRQTPTNNHTIARCGKEKPCRALLPIAAAACCSRLMEVVRSTHKVYHPPWSGWICCWRLEETDRWPLRPHIAVLSRLLLLLHTAALSGTAASKHARTHMHAPDNTP